MNSTKLIDLLKEQTKSLKDQYVEKTKEWAEKNYTIAMDHLEWKTKDWCKFFGIEPQLQNKGTHMEFLGYPNNFYNTKNSRTKHTIIEKAKKLKKLGRDEAINQAEKGAIMHYEESIEKLAYRIEQKGLDQTKIILKTSHIKQNIETVLTDGNKTVRAFTVLAWGEIQRPHYRYLIK